MISGVKRRPGAGVAAAALAGALALGCGRSPVGTSIADPSSRGGCAAGATALEARTLAQGLFSALAWNDGALLATGNDDVQSFPLAGAPADTLTHMSEARGLLVVGATVYFSASRPAGLPDPQGKQPSTTALFSVPLGGGEPTLFVDTPINVDGAVSDGTALYYPGWADAVTRIAIADGAQADLPLPPGLIIDSLALHAGALYVAAQDLRSMSATNGVILRMPATGGAVTTLVSNIGHPSSLVADASGLFWVEEPPIGQFGDSHVVRAGLDGQGAKTLLAHGASSLVVSDGALYLAWEGISKLPLAGGDEVPLVTGLMAPGLLTVSGGNAAWVDPVFQAQSATTSPSLMTACW